MPPRDEMTIDERRKYVKLVSERYRQARRRERSELLSEMEQVSKLHRKHLIRLLNGQSGDAQETQHTAQPQLWGGGRASGAAGMGESGLYLCRAADPQFGADGQAPGRLWLADLDSRSGEPAGDDQPGDGATTAAQEPRAQSTVTAQRPPPSQSSDQRSADGTHPLGDT